MPCEYDLSGWKSYSIFSYQHFGNARLTEFTCSTNLGTGLLFYYLEKNVSGYFIVIRKIIFYYLK